MVVMRKGEDHLQDYLTGLVLLKSQSNKKIVIVIVYYCPKGGQL